MQIFTMGFTQKRADIFFNLIREHHIEMLIDVRLNNQSQLAGFTKGRDLSFFLRELYNCEYSHEILFAPTKEILESYKKEEIDWKKYENEYNALITKRNIIEIFKEKYLKYNNIFFFFSLYVRT